MKKKFDTLERYLEEIDHHLDVEQGAEDILAEIRDQICGFVAHFILARNVEFFFLL